MPITVNDGLKTNAPRATDARYGKLGGGKTVPYATTAEALVAIAISYRHIGLTVNVANQEWWWKDDVTDDALVIKSNGASAGRAVLNLTADGSYVLPQGNFLTEIIVIPAADIVLKIGTSPGAEDILPATPIAANEEYPLSTLVSAIKADKTIYFSGLTAATQINIYKK